MSNVSSRMNKILGHQEVKEKPKDLLKALFAEFIGTQLLVMVACGACITWKVENATDLPPSTVQISLAFGIAVATMVQCIGHVSGGHINPAVTCGMLVVGKISLIKAILYILVQIVGAIAGAGILRWVTPSYAQGIGQTTLGKDVDVIQGLGIEYFITFVLVFTVFAVCDSNRDDLKGSAPLAIGLSVAMCHFWAARCTGASMNSARAIGPAVVMGVWDHHWIYWVGPCVGGMTAAIIYHTLFSAKCDSPRENAYLMHMRTQDGDKEGVSKGLMPGGDTCC